MHRRHAANTQHLPDFFSPRICRISLLQNQNTRRCFCCLSANRFNHRCRTRYRLPARHQIANRLAVRLHCYPKQRQCALCLLLVTAPGGGLCHGRKSLFSLCHRRAASRLDILKTGPGRCGKRLGTRLNKRRTTSRIKASPQTRFFNHHNLLHPRQTPPHGTAAGQRVMRVGGHHISPAHSAAKQRRGGAHYIHIGIGKAEHAHRRQCL